MNSAEPLFSICDHFNPCGGCSESLSRDPPPIWQEVLTFFAPFAMPELHAGFPVRWRHRAKVAVRGTSQHPLIGLFKRFSHEVLPIPACLVHHAHLNQAFEMIRVWMIQQGLQPYHEKTHQGHLRYLQGVVERSTGRVQLTFVLNLNKQDPQARNWQTLIHQLGEKSPHAGCNAKLLPPTGYLRKFLPEVV